jgi:hypothetical protein
MTEGIEEEVEDGALVVEEGEVVVEEIAGLPDEAVEEEEVEQFRLFWGIVVILFSEFNVRDRDGTILRERI